MSLIALAKDLKDQPFQTLARLQSQRPLWLAGAAVALGFEIFSVLYFQRHLGLFPCEYCVQIRLDMIAICLGGLVAALAPRLPPVKLAGWLLSFVSAAVGLKNSMVLESITVRTLHDPDYFHVCRPGKVDFIFNLPLDKWLPTHFRPDGICGEHPWIFLDLTMTQWLIVVYSIMLLALAMVFVSDFVKPGPQKTA